jgi:uncharacterized protein
MSEQRKRGFAAMTPERVKEIASMGGKRAHELGTAHEFTSEEAAEAGRKGGATISQDREHMRAIGRKGGQRTAQDQDHMSRIGSKGGSHPRQSSDE